MYHRFGETKYPSTNITEEQLDSHLNYLMEQKFTLVLDVQRIFKDGMYVNLEININLWMEEQ